MEASTAYLYGSLIRSFMHVKEVSGNKLNSFCKVRFYVYSRVRAEFFRNDVSFGKQMLFIPSEYHSFVFLTIVNSKLIIIVSFYIIICLDLLFVQAFVVVSTVIW